MNFTNFGFKLHTIFAALLVGLLVSSSAVGKPMPCDEEECNGSCAAKDCD